MSKGRVLIVDDEAIVRNTIKEILTSLKYEICGMFSTGETAVVEAEELKPDIILMDIDLEGYLDGFETARRINQLFSVPVVFISGKSDPNILENIKQSDGYGYVIKPFKTKDLLIAIEMAVYKFQAERQLKQQEQWLKTILKSVGEGLIVTDLNGSIEFFNTVATIILGVSREQVLGKQINEVIKVQNPYLQKLFNENLSQAEQSKFIKNENSFETTLLKLENEKKLVSFNINCILDINEEPQGFVIVFQDITKVKETNAQIRKLSFAIEQNPSAVLITDTYFRIDYVNAKFTEISGLELSNIRGHGIWEYQTNLPEQFLHDHLRITLLQGREYHGEWLSLNKNDESYWELVSITPITGDNGEVTHFLINKEDITERRKTELYLEENEKKYRDLFINSPISLWYMDYTEVKKYVDELRSYHIKDLRIYLETHRSSMLDILKTIRFIDVNQTTLDIFQAHDVEDLQKNITRIFANANENLFIEQLLAISENRFFLEKETFCTTLKGISKIISFKWYVPPESVNDYGKILISAIDITEKKIAETKLKKQTEVLQDKIKEQKVLFKIYQILEQKDQTPESVLFEIANIIPLAFRKPTFTHCQIEFDSQLYNSKDFKTSDFNFIIPISIKGKLTGEIRVYYSGPSMKEGAEIFLQEECDIVKIACGQLSRILEKKSIEKELQWENSFSNAIFDTLNSLIIVFNSQGHMIRFNKACEKVSGYKFEEIKFLSFWETLFLPEEFVNVKKYYQGMCQGKEMPPLEACWRTKDNRIRIVNWSSSFIRKPDGEMEFSILNGTDITDKKRSDEALKESQEAYRTLLENLNVGVFRNTGGEQGRYLQANLAMAQILGYPTLSAFMKTNEKDVYFYPEERKVIIKEAIELGFIRNREILFKKQDGSPVWIMLNAKVVYDGDGNYKWMDGNIQDIALSKKNREELKFQLNFLQNLIDSIPSPVYYKDINGLYLGCNVAFESLIGKPKTEFLSKKTLNIITPEYTEIFERSKHELITTQKTQIFESKIIDNQGNITDVIYYMALFYKDNGDVGGIISVILDISDRKLMEEVLRKANVLNENLLNSITSILILVNSENKVTYWNDKAEKFFHVSAKEVLNKSFIQLPTKWINEKLQTEISKVFETKQKIVLNSFEIENGDDSIHYLNLSISPYEDYSRTGGFLIIAEDVTEFKIMESSLMQAQKLESIGQLAAGVAHEINTPTQFIGDNTRFVKDSFGDLSTLMLMYGKLLSADNLSQEDIDKVTEYQNEIDLEYLLKEIPQALDQTLDGIERVSSIVKAMKEFSHPGVEDMVLSDINHLISSTIIVARNEWKYYADIKTDFQEDLPQVLCYPGEFNQAILNIIINAVHAIKDVIGANQNELGLITISTALVEENIIIRIKDNGPGIPEKIRNRIFDPFFTTKGVGKGTGQGLPIVRSIIVNKHQGEINFESIVGIGTTFVIKLPVRS